jgi:phage shock protein A
MACREVRDRKRRFGFDPDARPADERPFDRLSSPVRAVPALNPREGTETQMLKTLFTLARGARAAAEEDIADRSALLILDQQIRDAAAATARGKKALAMAVAQDEAEGRRLEATLTRIAAALKAGRDDLAGEAAEAIAFMEDDRDAIAEARAGFGREAVHLRAAVANAARRLADLERGRRIAKAADAVRRLKEGPSAGMGQAALAEAETTLRRLRERQTEDAAADAALRSMDSATASATLAERMESAGFGRRTRSSATDVLERLRKRNADPIQTT